MKAVTLWNNHLKDAVGNDETVGKILVEKIKIKKQRCQAINIQTAKASKSNFSWNQRQLNVYK